MKNSTMVSITSVLLIISCIYSIIITNNLKEDKRILLKSLVNLQVVMDECDNAYNANVKILDSVLLSHSTIEKRLQNYLHNEYRYKKENR